MMISRLSLICLTVFTQKDRDVDVFFTLKPDFFFSPFFIFTGRETSQDTSSLHVCTLTITPSVRGPNECSARLQEMVRWETPCSPPSFFFSSAVTVWIWIYCQLNFHTWLTSDWWSDGRFKPRCFALMSPLFPTRDGSTVRTSEGVGDDKSAKVVLFLSPLFKQRWRSQSETTGGKERLSGPNCSQARCGVKMMEMTVDSTANVQNPSCSNNCS